MHDWGDEGVDWEGINDAGCYIADYCAKYGRIGGIAKEKYGEVRYYVSFGYISLHSLLFPTYHHKHRYFPNWLWILDIYYISPFIGKIFGKLLDNWQLKVYNRAYQKALKRWPHLEAEILIGADCPELILGHSRVEGPYRHIINTKGKILSTRVTVGDSWEV